MRRAFLIVAVQFGCGHIGFDQLPVDAQQQPLIWVGPFVALSDPVQGTTDTFPAAAAAAGDAVAFQVFCSSGARPSAVTIAAPGWEIDLIGPIHGSTSSGNWVASFGAIAPDSAPAMFTSAWTVGRCGSTGVLGDEFAHANPAGGTITFASHAETDGVGDCSASVVTLGAGDALWGACESGGDIAAVGPGFSKGADDTAGDWSEYRVTTDGPGTAELVVFRNPGKSFALTAMSISAVNGR